MGSFFGGGESKQTTSSEQNTEYSNQSSQNLTPWEQASRGLNTATSMSTDFLNNPMQFFPDQTFLSNNAGQMGALEGLRDSAYGNMDIANTGLGAWMGMMAGPDQGLWDDRLNFYSGRAADALNRDIIPDINDQAVMSGGRRSSRAGIAEGLARSETGRNIMDFNNQLAMDFEGLKSQQQQFGLGIMPNMMNNMMMPGNQAYEAETALRMDDQRGLDEDMQRYSFDEESKRRNLAMMQQLLFQPAAAFGTTNASGSGTQNTTGTSTTTSEQDTGMFNKLLGGGLAVAGMMGGGGGMGGFNPMSFMSSLGGGGGGMDMSNGGIGYDPFMSSPYSMGMNPNMLSPRFASMG